MGKGRRASPCHNSHTSAPSEAGEEEGWRARDASLSSNAVAVASSGFTPIEEEVDDEEVPLNSWCVHNEGLDSAIACAFPRNRRGIRDALPGSSSCIADRRAPRPSTNRPHKRVGLAAPTDRPGARGAAHTTTTNLSTCAGCPKARRVCPLGARGKKTAAVEVSPEDDSDWSEPSTEDGVGCLAQAGSGDARPKQGPPPEEEVKSQMRSRASAWRDTRKRPALHSTKEGEHTESQRVKMRSFGAVTWRERGGAKKREKEKAQGRSLQEISLHY